MRTLIIGLDAFDPERFERLYEVGRVPNLARYVDTGRYARFAVSNPAQSEVSWTSIATGLNPGGHGMFDFVHRNPASYALNVSLLPTKRGLGGTQFAAPFNAPTIFDQAVKQGYPATALWWPAMFPARVRSPVQSIPGLGTPDLLGRLGVGTCFTTDKDLAQARDRKTPVVILQRKNGRYVASLPGPMRKRRAGAAPSTIEVQIEPASEQSATLFLGHHQLRLSVGEWSPILELKFELNFLFSIRALTRALVTEVGREVSLYLLPLQIHPLNSPWHYGTPRDFVKKTWQAVGPFLTVGWPQDTAALEDGFITDEQFIALCESIDNMREQALMYHLDHFHEGLLASVFDSLDRMQHMFWRDRPELIDKWYVMMDRLIGRIERRLEQRGLKNSTRLVIVSDHGFAGFDYKVHVNRWLLDNGYLQAKAPKPAGSFTDVDWSQSRAYAIGLNSLYLNLAGREGQGRVQASEKEGLLMELCDGLQQWSGPDGGPVLQHVWRREETFDGPLSAYGPDLVVGFAPGFRASAATGLGAWHAQTVEANHDHWGADHCIDPTAVPGVIFCSQELSNFPNPSYRDIPAITIGATPTAGGSTPPPTSSDTEDETVVEERLRSLGYL